MFHSERAPDFKTVLLASGLVLTLSWTGLLAAADFPGARLDA